MKLSRTIIRNLFTRFNPKPNRTVTKASHYNKIFQSNTEVIMKASTIILVLLSWSLALFAQGRIFIPHHPEWLRGDRHAEPVVLRSEDATITIRNGAANVKLEQVFFNPSSLRLEGEYILPLPGEAQVHDFNLYMNGKKVQGQVLDSRAAYRTYADIVRSMRDPALLEYSGHGLFKARIFPIEPQKERKIELSYAQTIPVGSGAFKFTLPIKQSGQGKIERFHLSVDLSAETPLSNIYSPSHQINVTQQNERTAHVSLEASNLEGDKDFVLYYSLSDREINASLITFRPRTDRDGYFMLLASPGFATVKPDKIAKDIIFVIDVSGSMQGEKIQQAREALRYCVNTLSPEDRFEIISFSSDVENFQSNLKKAGKDELENARYFIDNLRAGGGTNINGALQQALALKAAADNRASSIVFLTDGLPTEGQTDIGRILQNIPEKKKEFIRIFSFGVGYDVNTFLLDKLGEDSHGSANYVKPGENIEKEVSTFFAKISSPVLTSPHLDFGNLQVSEVYPQNLPDIFKGQRVSVIGRYRNNGRATITLTGKQGDRTRSFEYNLNFDRRENENEFIAKLWANRKVSHLLTQIRFNGENPELVESIKALGKEYGIVTPYTSYLVTEQKEELAAAPPRFKPLSRLHTISEVREQKAAVDEESVGSQVFFDALSAAPMAASKSSGKGAVMNSRAVKKIASSEKEMDMILTIKQVGERSFQLKNGVWVENGISPDSKAGKEIEFLSDAYFEFARTSPELSRILALGEEMKFQWKGEIIRIRAND